jgi:hypothetical protein
MFYCGCCYFVQEGGLNNENILSLLFRDDMNNTHSHTYRVEEEEEEEKNYFCGYVVV